jgi:hypothetical protein
MIPTLAGLIQPLDLDPCIKVGYSALRVRDPSLEQDIPFGPVNLEISRSDRRYAAAAMHLTGLAL